MAGSTDTMACDGEDFRIKNHRFDDGNKEDEHGYLPTLNEVETLFLRAIDRKSDKCISFSSLPKVYKDRWGAFRDTKHRLGYKNFFDFINSFPSMETYTEIKGKPMVRRRPSHRSNSNRRRDREWVDDEVPTKRRRRNPKSPRKRQASTTSSGVENVILVDTYRMLDQVSHQAPFKVRSESSFIGETMPKEIVAMDCVLGDDANNPYLIHVATEEYVYVLDCVALDSTSVYNMIRDMILSPSVLKLFHNVHRVATVFSALGGMDGLPQGTLDTELLMEAMTGRLRSELGETLEYFGINPQRKSLVADQAARNTKAFASRPIPKKLLQVTTDIVSLLLGIPQKLIPSSAAALGDGIIKVSDARVQSAAKLDGLRNVVFNKDNAYQLCSHELLHITRPTSIAPQHPLAVSNETDALLSLLQNDLSYSIYGQTDQLSDIVLDKGRRAVCWINDKRVSLGSENRLVNDADIDKVVASVGDFGSDNRAGMEQQLHRISAVRNRKDEIMGLTLRVGRYIVGNADIIRDLLFHLTSASILFLGEPGSGKTSTSIGNQKMSFERRYSHSVLDVYTAVVREVTKLLAEESNVSIVDTSNEIAGDGDIPHPCVGHARRLMVPSLDKQSQVMIECVQNHSPAVLVIDEIGRPTEVEAARTCRHRGVRLIASAHGDLRSLVKNPKLRGLVGDVKQVTVGDAEAKKKNGKFQKIRAQRAGPPTFDIIVELGRENPNHWRIITNAGQAVDAILGGTVYHVQRRIRNPESGAIQLQYEPV